MKKCFKVLYINVKMMKGIRNPNAFLLITYIGNKKTTTLSLMIELNSVIRTVKENDILSS